ncbi:BatA and WFA domain-containing protein [Candidatus Woesearchaeota archaeon]|nr:BatA and WFA domain-containing protein [Candidatus Woesearchaeota archaeon]
MEIFGHPIIVNNPIGFYSLIALIFFIILYFLKPKPFKKIIPSIIFLEGQKKRKALFSFFGKFVKDWLFVLQLLVIVLLCLSTLNLSTIMNIATQSNEVVFVIDASASSQVREGTQTRFEKAVDLAKSNLGVKNSIVLIKSTPLLVAKQTNIINARRLLSSIKPTESTSNIWDAMLMAGDIAEENNAKIIVLSDFIDTGMRDVLVAKDILESKGFQVVLVNIASSKKNNGIIEYELEANEITIYVKNFDDSASTINMERKNYVIPAYSVESIKLPLQEGLNIYDINSKDDFEIDNLIYIIIPKKKMVSVLYISSSKDSFVYNALISIPNINVKTAEPPILPKFDYDLIIFDEVDPSKILSGTFTDLKTAVINGASVVIMANERLDDYKYGDLLPVSLEQLENANMPIVNTKNIDTTQEINFEQSSKYFKATLTKNNSLVVAETLDGMPIITLTQYEKGKVLYYGIIDEYNSFKTSIDYPVFWYEMVKKLTGQQTPSLLNREVGDVITGKRIVLPDNSVAGEYVTAEKTGVYEVDDLEIAVNLVNAQESNINSQIAEQESFIKNVEKKKTKQEISLLFSITALASILMLVEIYFLKKGGEL